MPPRSFPAQPIFADESERVVWQALMDQLPVDAAVICNLKIIEHDQEYEMDLIVLIPDMGVAVIEVKGGEVTPNEDSTFTQKDRKGRREIDPMGQATKNMHELERFLAPRASVRHFSARPAVVLPYAAISTTYSRPSIPRGLIHDSEDLFNLGDRIMKDLGNHHFRPTAIELSGVLSALNVALSSQKSFIEKGVEREKEVIELTQQQFAILDLCIAMPKFSILGSAGCGKTYIAIEQARRRAAAGDRVLFLCYNYGLSEYIRRRFVDFAQIEQLTIGTLHSLGNKLGMNSERGNGDNYWDSVLPEQLVEHLNSMAPELKYDTVVIDEAQDFHADWWSVVIGALKDQDKGRIYAFGDIRQGIFRQATDIPLQNAKLHLDKNLRNALPIAHLATLCVEEPLELIGLDGPPVQWIESTTEESENAANKEVEKLISQGWDPSEICVLTTGSRHEVQRTLGDGPKSRPYWQTFFDEQSVYHCTIGGFKGLERRAVVIAMNGWKEPDRKKDILYTGITRARDLLIICGSREEITHAGGKEFFKKLTRTN